MRLLLVTYYFPPCGGAAVMRWYRLIRALNKLGHHITVICPQEADYPQYDESLVLPNDQLLKIRRAGKTSIFKLWSKLSPRALPYGSLETKSSDGLIRRMLIWIRLNLIIPDIRLLWVPAAVGAIKNELRAGSYDAVITTGPPHSTHLAAYFLRRKLRFCWIADFRDPWSKIHYLSLAKPSAPAMAIHKYLEKRVLAKVDLAFVVSRYISESLAQGNKMVVYNGYSSEDFADLHYQISDRFRIKYIGSITAGQKPELMIRLLAKCDLEADLYMIGSRDDYNWQTPAKINIKTMPFLQHRQALEEMVQSELLVLLINDYPGSQGMLTTKVFEYIASGRPILCLGNVKSEAAQLVMENGRGVACEYDELSESINYVEDLYRKWSESKPLGYTTNSTSYESSHQASEIVRAIEKAIHS